MIQSDDSFGFNCRQLFGISKTQVMTISKLNAAGLQRLRQSIIFQNERNLVSVIDPELDQINSLALGQEDFDADHPPCFEFIRPYLDILFQLRAEKSILSSSTPIFDLQNKLLAKIFADKNLEYTPILPSDLTEVIATIKKFLANDKLFYTRKSSKHLVNNFFELDKLLTILGIEGSISSKSFVPEFMLPSLDRKDWAKYLTRYQSQDPLFLTLKNNWNTFESINSADFLDKLSLALENLPNVEKINLIKLLAIFMTNKDTLAINDIIGYLKPKDESGIHLDKRVGDVELAKICIELSPERMFTVLSAELRRLGQYKDPESGEQKEHAHKNLDLLGNFDGLLLGGGTSQFIKDFNLIISRSSYSTKSLEVKKKFLKLIFTDCKGRSAQALQLFDNIISKAEIEEVGATDSIFQFYSNPGFKKAFELCVKNNIVDLSSFQEVVAMVTSDSTQLVEYFQNLNRSYGGLYLPSNQHQQLASPDSEAAVLRNSRMLGLTNKQPWEILELYQAGRKISNPTKIKNTILFNCLPFAEGFSFDRQQKSLELSPQDLKLVQINIDELRKRLNFGLSSSPSLEIIDNCKSLLSKMPSQSYLSPVGNYNYLTSLYEYCNTELADVKTTPSVIEFREVFISKLSRMLAGAQSNKTENDDKSSIVNFRLIAGDQNYDYIIAEVQRLCTADCKNTIPQNLGNTSETTNIVAQKNLWLVDNKNNFIGSVELAIVKRKIERVETNICLIQGVNYNKKHENSVDPQVYLSELVKYLKKYCPEDMQIAIVLNSSIISNREPILSEVKKLVTTNVVIDPVMISNSPEYLVTKIGLL